MSADSYRDRVYAQYASKKNTAFLSYTEADYARGVPATLHRIKSWLPDAKDARCVDIACGGGHILYLLRTLGYKNVSGVDASPEQVALARRVCPDVQLANAIEFLRANSSQFDFITGYDIIEHFRKDELFEFLDALFSALRPKGRLVLQTPNAESPWGMTQRYHDITHEIAFDSQSLQHVLTLAGFVNYEARECGPYIHGAKSLARATLWRAIKLGLKIWNIAECGSVGSGIYTRVLIAKADKADIDLA